MKKNSLNKRLSNYSACAVSFLAFAHQSSGQVLYTDVDPDITLNLCDTLPLDLNNDGITDFELAVGQHIFDYWHACFILDIPGELNYVAGFATYTSYGNSSDYLKLPSKLNYLDQIGATLNWVRPRDFNKWTWCNGSPFYGSEQAAFNFFSTSAYAYFGYWTEDLTDGYVGLAVNLNNQNYYGWARLVVDTNARWMILKDYAINTVPDESIGAGQCMCPPSEVESIKKVEETISVGPNPSSDKFIVKSKENIAISQIKIFDIQNKEQILYWVNNNSEWIADVHSLSDGIYFLEIQVSTQTVRKKILVQH